MFDKWFYIHLGKMSDPVTGDELNELAETGRLDARDLIWRVEASPKEAVRAGSCLIFFLSGGTPKPPPVEESPRLAMPVAPASPAAPAPAPAWLRDLADIASEVPEAPPAPSASPLDWLQDVRNTEPTPKRREKQ